MTENSEEKRLRIRWTIAIFLFGGLGAGVLQLRGALLPNIESTFQVQKGLLGLIAPAGTIGFTASVFLFGMLAGKLDVKKAALISAVLVVILTAAVGLSPTYFALLGVVAARGITAGVFRGLDKPILSHFYPDRLGWIYNLFASLWATGAASGPLLATLILKFWNWRAVYVLFGLGFVPVVYLVFTTRFNSEASREEVLTVEKLKGMLHNPQILAMIGAVTLHTATEGAFFTWLPYYMTRFFDQDLANISLSLFLIAYVPGTLVNSWLVRKFEYDSLVIFNSLAAAVFLILCFFLAGGYSAMALVFVIGFFMGSIIPNSLAWGTEVFPSHSGPINALVMGAGALGVSISPAAIGVVAESYSLAWGMKGIFLFMTGVGLLTILGKEVAKRKTY